MAKKIEDEEATESKEFLQTAKNDPQSGKQKSGWIFGMFVVLGLLVVGIVVAISHFNTNQDTSDEITFDYHHDYEYYEQNDDDYSYTDEYPDVGEHLSGSSSKIADMREVRLTLKIQYNLGK